MWNKVIQFGLPVLAAVSLGFGAATTMILKPEEQLTDAPKPPAISTFRGAYLAGLGEVQPPGEPIKVGAEISGVLRKVNAVEGMEVHQGDVLVEFSSRIVERQLERAQAELALQIARLERLRAGTRPHDFPIALANRDAALAARDRTSLEFARGEKLVSKNAISASEFETLKGQRLEAEARLAEIDAQLAKMRAGSWDKDIAIAENEAEVARANVSAMQAELSRYRVTAPCDATVLRVDVRRGECFDANTRGKPLVTLAPAGKLQVRVQIDEEDAGSFSEHAIAEAFVRGTNRHRIELQFVRLEPQVVPKLSSVGSPTERVDTRVLFVVYEVKPTLVRLYTGQRLDVFIQCEPAVTGSSDALCAAAPASTPKR